MRVSATYCWSGKKYLLRRGREEDWGLFCEVVRKAWMREGFGEDGCEVEMLVHAE